jgi:hypothetical protein
MNLLVLLVGVLRRARADQVILCAHPHGRQPEAVAVGDRGSSARVPAPAISTCLCPAGETFGHGRRLRCCACAQRVPATPLR